MIGQLGTVARGHGQRRAADNRAGDRRTRQIDDITDGDSVDLTAKACRIVELEDAGVAKRNQLSIRAAELQRSTAADCRRTRTADRTHNVHDATGCCQDPRVYHAVADS